MKVLMMHSNDGRPGGAQIQMDRFRTGLRGAGVDVRILCREGDPDEVMVRRIPIPLLDLGYLSSERLKAIAYATADVLINPSRAESFGLVVLESMACGTPVGAFGGGGFRSWSARESQANWWNPRIPAAWRNKSPAYWKTAGNWRRWGVGAEAWR